MADSISDADKIRNKRLAKLGGQAPTPQSSQAGEGSKDGLAASAAADNAGDPDALGLQAKEQSGPKINTSSSPIASTTTITPPPPHEEDVKPKINISSSSSNASTPSQNPFSQLGMRQTNGDASKINVASLPGRSITPQKRDRPTSSGRNVNSRAGETLEEWEDRTLSNVFKFTLDPEAQPDTHGHRKYYLESTRQGLDEQNEPIRLNTGLLDQTILEAASNLKKGTTPLDYLLGCWKRVSRQYKALKKAGEQDQKLNIIKEARRLCMSYCIFAVTLPDMFGLEPPSSNPLTLHLLIEDPEDDRGIDHEFLTEAISRFVEDDTVQDAFVGAVEELSRQLATKSMSSDYKPYIMALRNLVQYPAMVNSIVQSPRFLPASMPAAMISTGTLLGPFFAISPLQGDVTVNYFSSPTTRDKTYILNSQRALRLTLQTHQFDLFQIINHFIKASKESRDRTLDWFALCVNANHKRRAMQVDQTQVSSDGFMINITVCLDQLCEPFMDASFSKIDRIDINYLRRAPRVDIKDETKLNADQNASDAFYSTPAEGTSNFISEVFFLTVAAHHYGTEAANSILSSLEKDLKRMKKHVEEIELDRHKFVRDPTRLRMFEDAVKKYKDRIDTGMSYKYSIEGVLLDDLNQARSMQFMRYVVVWMLRLVSPLHNFPKQALQLPLSQEQPEVFKCLPEYFLEDIVGNFKFIMRNMPQIITSTQSDELVMLCITFLRSSEYVKNPYLKSGLVTIMFHGIWPVYNRSKGILGDLLNSIPIATDHLLHALMKFYIEVEVTGAHTQFYDKFNIRYEIFQIIKCIWSNPVYREHLSDEAKINLDFFVRFVNLLLNDVTFVLDESLTAFVQIHTLQEELKHAGPTMDQTIRSEKEEALSAAQGKAKSYMQLTNETVSMLKLFTDALADSFTMPEIVQRLADMLDYNLDAMVGPKSKDLMVENPQEYGFQPKTLLSEIIDVYLNLRTKENFVFAVARDGRSYKPANFEGATRILQKFALKGPEDIAAWQSLGVKFANAKAADDQAEEDLGEIPEEFLDPLMYTMMIDPVILPTSKTSIDRSTIRSHLLSDPNDPFNRSPLKIEDVIPDTDLLSRIQAFKKERKDKALANANIMDVTPG